MRFFSQVHDVRALRLVTCTTILFLLATNILYACAAFPRSASVTGVDLRRQSNGSTALPLHHIAFDLPTGTLSGIAAKDYFTVSAVQMAVRIDDFRARVLMDIVFGVSSSLPSFVTEAVVKIGLPSTASPYYLAFGQDPYYVSPPIEPATTIPPKTVISREAAPLTNSTAAPSAPGRRQTLFNAIGPFLSMAFSTFKQVVTEPLIPAATPQTTTASRPQTTIPGQTTTTPFTLTKTATATTVAPTTQAPPTTPLPNGLFDEDPVEWELSEVAARRMRNSRWVDGLVREAVMVKKAVASRAYTDAVRRGVDPALLEQSDTGSYSLRVYPLFRGRQHRLSIGYDVELRDSCNTPLGSECSNASSLFRYQLALPSPRDNVLMDISVSRSAAKQAAISSASHSLLADLARNSLLANPTEINPTKSSAGGATTTGIEDGRVYATIAPDAFNATHAPNGVPATVDLDFYVGAPAQAAPMAAVGLVSYRGSLGTSISTPTNQTHFAVDVSLASSQVNGGLASFGLAPSASTTTANKTLLFMIDTSLSSGYRSSNTSSPYELTIASLERLLTESRGHPTTSVTFFNVALFDVTVEWWKGPPGRWIPNTAEQVAEAVSFLRSVSLAGATDLATALDYATRAKSDFTTEEITAVQGHSATSSDSASAYGLPRWDVILACDGGATWGDVDLRSAITLVQQRQIMVFGLSHYLASGNGAVNVISGNENVLRDIVLSSGGDFLLSKPTDAVAVSLAQLRVRPIRIVDARVYSTSGDSAVDCVLDRTSDGAFAFLERRIVVAGRFAGANQVPSVVTLTTVHMATGAVATMNFTISRVMYSPLATRVYGSAATRRLEFAFPDTAEASSAYAVAYRVVGKSASLLMLESSSDYASYGIDPTKDPLVAAATVVAKPAVTVLAEATKQQVASRTDARQRLIADINYVATYSGNTPIVLPWYLWALVNGTKDASRFDLASATVKLNSLVALRTARGVDLKANNGSLQSFRSLLQSTQRPYATWDDQRSGLNYSPTPCERFRRS